MPRLARCVFADITQRSNRREDMFFQMMIGLSILEGYVSVKC
ncbi:MAG: hypothetical protein ABGX71_11845 [Methyloprofundus sp.]